MTSPLRALSFLRHIPHFTPFAVAALLLGTATSFTGPYLPLFAREAAHMSPLSLGVFMTLVSLSGILISTGLARWSDRRPGNRAVVLLTVLAAAVGFALLSMTRSYLPLVLIGCLFLGTGAGAFPQLFALARAGFGMAGPELAERGMITLRSVFSMAWMLGPAVAALILARLGFTGLFLATAACYLTVGLPLLLARFRPAPRPPASERDSAGTPPGDAGPARRPLALVALSFVLYGISNNMGFIALPLHVTGALHAPESTVGFLVGLCALLEIPFILGFALWPRRVPHERLITLSFALFAGYFVLLALAPAVWVLAAAQLVRAAVIAVTTTLGMAYFQELMPGRTGTALTLYTNTGSVGAVLSGVVSGAFAQAFGYQAVFLLCAGLTGAAFLLLAALTLRQPGGSPVPGPGQQTGVPGSPEVVRPARSL
ncbi:putative sugar efflux transporter (plasmid) [Deinococcus aetherius]|uniref:Sugar efflux transporter n=1 Tax=Deinococcus aetherius TaxID=200252 RepID=A0ABN6RR48_9DEIO|nr:sugar efflux transporter [Deinococcus aetherius]BDP44459.1 putative sugar efflux transporter [Deinococcus aetherius]